jgi:hypothetical protein
VAARRCCGDARHNRGRVGVAVKQVVVACSVAEVEPVRLENKSSGDVVKPRDRVTGCTVRASAIDQGEVERLDGASGCTT